MSKVISIETLTETVTHEIKMINALKCDVCGKEFTGKYWELNTYHYDWGNDSIDSNEYFDLCSDNCVRTKLEGYFKECKHSITQHFDLSQELFKPHKEGN